MPRPAHNAAPPSASALPARRAPVPAAVLDLLCCPVCHGALTQPAEATIQCTACQRRYPLRDGIPVLIASASLA
ncbi:Trm112 family protein [Acidipila sp. EB88]|uniref:Trm112 family protein n=1 Tax=Acidipila sp. EB88 TaxID=2305226 RepID=UPI000F5DAE38|nr:Trm112 family protein [Acidipila sp. EB88]RRA48334.1 hypothetical protein D1Y84_08580 [Acidipila sp. EB88]